MYFPQWTDVPLNQRRGIDSLDTNDFLFLVQAPIEQVAQALGQLRQVMFWQRDVYEREIEILDGYGLVIFQFQGHLWTVIRDLNFIPYQVRLENKEAHLLSSVLQTKAICYHISDSSGNIGYHLYDCGKSIEELYFTHERERKMDEDEKDLLAQGTCQFQSRLRQLDANDIKDAYSFAEAFFLEQDAYVPALSWNLLSFRIGQRFTPKVEDLEPNDFERMDYLVLN